MPEQIEQNDSTLPTIRVTDGGSYNIELHDEKDIENLNKLTGVHDTLVQAMRIHDVCITDPRDCDKEYKIEMAMRQLNEIKPRDNLESMMATQMIAIHNQFVYCLRVANYKENSYEVREDTRNQAIKLSRTFAYLMETLKRYRSKNEQIVKHIYVDNRGQAVFGTVNVDRGGKNEN